MPVSPLTAVMSKSLFDAVRVIKGAPLTQHDVDGLNRALMAEVAAVARTGMRMGREGRFLLEGFESYQATTYKDPGPTGLPITGGWGTTRDENGKPFILGRTYPLEYWKRLKERDLVEFETGVNLLLRGAPTTQNQFDALVSFAYNVGLDIDDDDVAEGLGDSTLLKRHLAGDYAGAQAAFAAWNKAKGKVLNGLVRRRAAEAKLYGGG